MNKYQKIKTDKLYKSDKNMCSVIATSIACRVPYDKAYKALENHGRKHGQGTYWYQQSAAIQELGCELEKVFNRGNRPLRQKNGSKYTPKTIGERLKKGYYICRVRGHVFAVVNGEVLDWTDGRNHHINEVYKVKVPRGSRS